MIVSGGIHMYSLWCHNDYNSHTDRSSILHIMMKSMNILIYVYDLLGCSLNQGPISRMILGPRVIRLLIIMMYILSSSLIHYKWVIVTMILCTCNYHESKCWQVHGVLDRYDHRLILIEVKSTGNHKYCIIG